MSDIDTDTRHADLERRLRAAAATVPARPLPGDAWVQHQRRLAAAGKARSTRILAVAAVVALVLVVVGLATLSSRIDAAPPAGGGSDDFWAPENILGEPVVAEQLRLGGVPTEHELVLSDTTGKGPSLCDRFTAADASAASGGCSSRDPEADRPEVAVDWLSGTTGGGDLHGVVAGVDGRVAKVRIYLSNGDMVLADLHPTGWEDTKMFALTLQDEDAPGVPQRLVAYADARGTVLQAVDLTQLFGDDWLPPGRACGVEGLAPTSIPMGDDGQVNAQAFATPREVQVVTDPAGGPAANPCFSTESHDRTVTIRRTGDSTVVALVAPEVVLVSLQGSGMPTWTVQPHAVQGSLWKVAAFDVGQAVPADAVAIAQDDAQVLARQHVPELQ